MLAVAEERFIVARTTVVFLVPHVLVELVFARVAAGAVVIAVLAARNHVVTSPNNDGLRGSGCWVHLGDEARASLGALNMLQAGTLSRHKFIVANLDAEADGAGDRITGGATRNELVTLLALFAIIHVHVAVTLASSLAAIVRPSLSGVAREALLLRVERGNVRVANFTSVTIAALLTVRIVNGFALSAFLSSLVQVVALTATGTLAG